MLLSHTFESSAVHLKTLNSLFGEVLMSSAFVNRIEIRKATTLNTMKGKPYICLKKIPLESLPYKD